MKIVTVFARLFLFLLFIFWILLTNSCKNKINQHHIRQADSIISITIQSSNTLIIDEDVIRSRMDTMKTQINFLEINKSKLNQDMIHQFNQYLAIYKKYETFINVYPALEFDNTNYSIRAKNLKEELISGNISENEFDTTYQVFKKEISSHLQECREQTGIISSIENMYYRTREDIKGIMAYVNSSKNRN